MVTVFVPFAEVNILLYDSCQLTFFHNVKFLKIADGVIVVP